MANRSNYYPRILRLQSWEVQNLIKDIENYNTTDIELKNLSENYNNEISKLKKDRAILKENILEAKKSKKARDIVKQNEKSYFEYCESQEKLKEKRENHNNLLEEERLNTQYQHNIEKLELSNKNLKDDIEKLEENISKNLLLKENLETEISEFEIKEQALNSKLNEYENLLVDLEKLEEFKRIKLENRLQKLAEIDLFQKDLVSKKEIFENIDIEQIKKQLAYFEDLEIELKLLQEQKVICETEIKTLKKSSKELKNKICPFLNEKCQNLEDKEIGDYFSSKISMITEDLENLKEDIEKKSKILTEKEIFEDRKKKYSELKKYIENLELSIKNEEINLKEIELDIKHLDIDIQKLTENKEIQDSLTLREKKKEIEVELRNLNLDQKRENLENLIESLRLEEEKILKNQDSIKENLSEIEKYSKKIVVGTNKKIVLLKENIDYLENIIESLKATYDEYLKNNILAKGLEILLLKVEKNIKDLYGLRLNKNQLK